MRRIKLLQKKTDAKLRKAEAEYFRMLRRESAGESRRRKRS